MADPFTLLAAASTGLKVIGGLQEAGAERRAAREREVALRQQGDRERAISQQEAIRREREESRVLARQRAVGGQSFSNTASGSLLEIAQETAADSHLETLTALSAGENRARTSDINASFERRRGRNAIIGGGIRAANTIVGDVANNKGFG